MRIIKDGKLPHKEKKMTCSECGCVFMYERADTSSCTVDEAELKKNSNAEEEVFGVKLSFWIN